VIAVPVLVAALAACGSGSGSSSAAIGNVSTSAAAAARAAREVGGATLAIWPEFGFDPQRSDAVDAPTGITAANVGKLRDRRLTLPGTIDSSPIYLGGAKVRGGTHDVAVMTSSYGRTFALDASSGNRLWTYTPPGYSSLVGTPQLTNTSPLLDPDHRFVYTASPDGVVHKLTLAGGKEVRSGHWPVTITEDPTREKMASALNVDGPYVIATTGGYNGDAPIYQGHVVLIDRASGKVAAVFNSLCADRRTIIVPSSCPQSDSAVLSRGGAVVEPGGERLLVDTGNGTWDGKRYFGDSVLELTVPGLRLRQSFTPTNQAELNSGDVDLGSSAPALLGGNRAMAAGKDGILRVLNLARLDGHPPGGKARLGGEVQTLRDPGASALFTQPAVWRHGKETTVFVAGFTGTGAYVLRGGELHPLWENATPGTSPVFAGGLLYVYEPTAGGIEVYRPTSSRPITKLPGKPGHWNSPIVAGGHVIEPEGSANDLSGSGTIDLFSASK
jgi:hypothetical protein